MKLLNDNDTALMEARLRLVLDKHLDAPGLAAMKGLVRDYVLAGGKRVRPQLTAWTYQMSRGPDEPLSEAALDAAAGWELFHAFLLVHDDIIDESPRRREQRALHYQLASLDSDSIRFGTNLGIVAGDLLFSAAMCVWHGLDVEPKIHRDLLRLISRIACTTGFGQAIDICVSHLPMDELDQETLLREYHWKTAAYTFEGPMLSGAILAGLGEAQREALSKYALALGQAYQLQNDLIDLAKPADEGCDLVQGKRTLTLLHYRTQLSTDERARLDERLSTLAAARDGNAVTQAESLRQALLASDALTTSRQMISQLLSDARAASTDSSLPATLSSGMGRVLDDLTRVYFR